MNEQKIKNENLKVNLLDVDDILEKAEKIAKELSGNQTKTQVRRLFGMLREFERKYWKKEKDYNKLIEELKFMKPKIVYQVARNKDIKVLKEPLIDAIEQINENNIDETFPRLVKFMESIIAYFEEKSGG